MAWKSSFESNSIMLISKWAIKNFIHISAKKRKIFSLSFIAIGNLNVWRRKSLIIDWETSHENPLICRSLAVVAHKFFHHQTFMKSSSAACWELVSSFKFPTVFFQDFTCHKLSSTWVTTIGFASVKKKDFPSNFG